MADEYYFPWYPVHYRRDAGHLDHLPDSCYRRLIDAYMEGGEPLKKDPIRLMAIMRVTPEQFSMVWPQIEVFFTLSVDGRLQHTRCDFELGRQDTSKRQKSAAGKRSAAKRRKLRIQQNRILKLANGRSTDVQRSLDGLPTTVPLRESKEIESKLILPPKSTNGSNGHMHTNGNGKSMDFNSSHASRAFRNGEPTKEKKHELFEAKMLRFALVHRSHDDYAEMIRLQLSSEPDDKRRRKDFFNMIHADYEAREMAGTLQPI